MARIPKGELERVRQVPVRELVEAAGVELKKRGKDLAGLCPLHDDHDASLVVTEEKNVWHCFGCQAGGGSIDWVMAHQGLGFRAAAEHLLARVSPGEDVDAPSGRVLELARSLSPWMSDAELLLTVVDYYQAVLEETPEALAYLDERGLSHELVSTHRLGYCDRSLGYRLDQDYRDQVRARLSELGVLRKSGHEHLPGALVVPVFTEDGSIGELYGRRISKKATSASRHLYLPGPHRGVFNLDNLDLDAGTIVLCESLIDALTFVAAGMTSVTASFGTEGFTDELAAALVARKPKRVVLAYDADAAGDKAAEKVAGQLREAGLFCARAKFPKGMDANEYARKVAPANKSLALVVDKAEPMAPTPSNPPKRTTAVGAENEPKHFPPSEAKEQAPLAAEPKPAPAKQTDCELIVEDHQLTVVFGPRRYRVRGLERNVPTYEQLKVNVLCQKEGAGFHVDSFDLYQSKPRTAFIKVAAFELGEQEGVLKRDLGRLLGKLEQWLEQRRAEEREQRDKVPELSEEEHAEAMAFLKREDLLEAVLSDFEAIGVVGEEENKLMAYLAATSRKLERPLAVMIQSSSAAGKSSLMDAVLKLIPDEEKVAYSAMTGQSLFYMADIDLSHKVLAIAEEEGAEHASYALKILQSEGKLRIASTGKDGQSGRHTTHEYEVEGPVAILSTTTAVDVDEELLNRCLVLSVDESAEQTKAIHQLQRKSRTLDGLLGRLRRESVVKRHQNAQRLLRPLHVVNPFAEELSFGSKKTRSRRDHEKYLSLIETICLLHQHQRQLRVAKPQEEAIEYIEATRDDVEAADRLMFRAQAETVLDLPPQTAVFLEKVKALVSLLAREEAKAEHDVRFCRRQLIEHTGQSLTAVRKHLERLVVSELLVMHRGRGRTFFYELCLLGPRQGEGPALAPQAPALAPHWHPNGMGEAPRANGHHLNDSSTLELCGILDDKSQVKRAEDATQATSAPAPNGAHG